MTEKELFDRLIEIRNGADFAGRRHIKRMVNALIRDRWGTDTQRKESFKE
jgi:hypothetical protein